MRDYENIPGFIRFDMNGLVAVFADILYCAADNNNSEGNKGEHFHCVEVGYFAPIGAEVGKIPVAQFDTLDECFTYWADRGAGYSEDEKTRLTAQLDQFRSAKDNGAESDPVTKMLEEMFSL